MKQVLDGNVAMLDITGPHTAEQLDALLRKLALLRADMMQPIPATRDEVVKSDTVVLIEDKPALVIRARQGGGFRLWLRHCGFGWLGYQIDSQVADTLADYVISFRTSGEAVNLIKHDEPNRH